MAAKQKESKKQTRYIRSKITALLFSFVLILSLGYFFKDFLLAVPRDLKISNVTSTSATVTWVTSSKSPGILLIKDNAKYTNTFLDIFSSEKYFDDRDKHITSRRSTIDLNRRYTHTVTLQNLKSDTKYDFRISNGIYVWDIENIESSEKWYSIENSKTTSINTLTQSDGPIVMPQTLYGSVEDMELEGYSDAIVFAEVYGVDEKGEVDTSKKSSTISTFVNETGGWVLDYSSALNEVTSEEKQVYLFAHIENKTDSPGQFEKASEGNQFVDLFKYDRMQSLEKTFLKSIYTPSDVSAAGPDLCCAMIISGKKNVYFDWENDAPCSACGNGCFNKGDKFLGGTIQEVVGVSASDQNSCESIKRLASEGLPPAGGPGGGDGDGNGGTFGGTCNAFLKDSEFEVAEIDREQLISYANRLAGDGSQAAECFNYVVCKAKQNGINPAMMLNIWVHESAASNYKRFPGVEDMGIHCYGGAGNYPAYSCNTTPKEDIKAQTEMFGLLPHTKCLDGGFDIVKWSTGFWTGNCEDTSFGERFYEDLKLQWSSYGKGAFPTWIKKPSTAQPNLKCDTDGATSPETPSNGNNNGNNGSNGGNNGSNGNGNVPTTPNESDTPREMCCAVLLEGENVFRSKVVTSTSCQAAHKPGSQFTSGSVSGTVEYGVEIQGQKTDTPPPLCCAIIYEGRSNIYFDYENKGNCNSCGQCFPVGKTVGGSKVKAVGSEPLRGNTDPEWRANCESTVRPISEGVPPDTPAGSILATCNGGSYAVNCQNGLPTPKDRNSVAPYGTNSKCVNPNDPPKDDGITNIPITKTNSKIFTQLLTTAFAAESKVKGVDKGVVTFTEDGIYDIQIGDYKVSNVSVNSDAKYRFYEDKNNSRGFQPNKDTEITPKNISEVKATKVESGFRLELNSGYNFIAVNYRRDPNSIVVSPENPDDITAKAILDIANVDEIKVTHLTTFESGKWVGGVRPRDDKKYGILGNSFTIKQNSGYVVVANSDLKGSNAIVLPGKRVNAKIETKLPVGWSFVGITGKIEPARSLGYVAELMKAHSPGRLVMTKWDDKKGLFESVQTIDNEVYGVDFSLSNLAGYFFFTDKSIDLK